LYSQVLKWRYLRGRIHEGVLFFPERGGGRRSFATEKNLLLFKYIEGRIEEKKEVFGRKSDRMSSYEEK